jgi:hypothetical protein
MSSKTSKSILMHSRISEAELVALGVVTDLRCRYRKLFDARKAIGKYLDNDITLLAARVSRYAHIDRRGALAILMAPRPCAGLRSS